MHLKLLPMIVALIIFYLIVGGFLVVEVFLVVRFGCFGVFLLLDSITRTRLQFSHVFKM